MRDNQIQHSAITSKKRGRNGDGGRSMRRGKGRFSRTKDPRPNTHNQKTLKEETSINTKRNKQVSLISPFVSSAFIPTSTQHCCFFGR